MKLAEYEKALTENDRALEMSEDEWLEACIEMNRETAERLLLKGERKVWGRTPVNIARQHQNQKKQKLNFVEELL